MTGGVIERKDLHLDIQYPPVSERSCQMPVGGTLETCRLEEREKWHRRVGKMRMIRVREEENVCIYHHSGH